MQKGLNRLEKYMGRNCMNGKCKVLGRNKIPRTCTDQLETRYAEKVLGVLVDTNPGRAILEQKGTNKEGQNS